MALNKYQEDTLTSTGSEFHVFYQVYSGNDKDVDRYVITKSMIPCTCCLMEI